MSLQRRLMLYLLVVAPLVWAVAVLVSVDRTRHEVNELYDTELIRLARQVQATLVPALPAQGAAILQSPPGAASAGSGEGDLRDLAVAVWNADGRLLISDREGVQLPYQASASGFRDATIGGAAWRIYYLQSFSGQQLVAAGQGVYERDEVVFGLIASQLLPWLLVLPALLLAMGWAVRRALAPVHGLTAELRSRDAANLSPLPEAHAPAELKPLVSAMNGLFARVDQLLVRERRFTADAAHELRTPLAVLRAQWDVVKGSAGHDERMHAQQQLDAGLARMDRLVTQMLALSQADAASGPLPSDDLRWPAIVEQVMSDCLPLALQRRVELACDWPPDGRPAFPLAGDAHLMTVLLRNLMDNAVRYAPAGSTVTLRFGREQLEVENGGPPLAPQQLAAMGQRFQRPLGQLQDGSGLGVSIVQRIAALHGLALSYGTWPDGSGVRAVLQAQPTSA
jgi:two-component system sensor histidine kinase QseC